jgi:hypothetical protein
VGFVDNSVVLAHYAMLAEIKDFCEDNGWSILRYDDASFNRELIMAAPGYIGPDGAVPAYVGVRTYHDVGNDYYNLSVAGFTGYVSGNTWATQPGFLECGVPAHNQRIDYWMTINDRRLAFALKVGTPVYESAYIGFALPYATPRQYPYPLFVGGMLVGAAATRFSETTHASYFYGNRNNCRLRFVDGSWLAPRIWPYQNAELMAGGTTDYSMRPLNTHYPLMRMVMNNASNNVYGELEGVYAITGFDNVVENTLTVGGVQHVVIQDVARNGFNNYYALQLEP